MLGRRTSMIRRPEAACSSHQSARLKMQRNSVILYVWPVLARIVIGVVMFSAPSAFARDRARRCLFFIKRQCFGLGIGWSLIAARAGDYQFWYHQLVGWFLPRTGPWLSARPHLGMRIQRIAPVGGSRVRSHFRPSGNRQVAAVFFCTWLVESLKAGLAT